MTIIIKSLIDACNLCNTFSAVVPSETIKKAKKKKNKKKKKELFSREKFFLKRHLFSANELGRGKPEFRKRQQRFRPATLFASEAKTHYNKYI